MFEGYAVGASCDPSRPDAVFPAFSRTATSPAVEDVCPAGRAAFEARVAELFNGSGRDLFVGVVEEFDYSVALLQREYGVDHRPMYYCRKNSISGAPSVDVLSKAARKALAARNVLDDAVHAVALRQLHARAARVFGSRKKADAAAAEWREKNRAFQRENCTDVDPREKLLDGDAARPTTIFDDDQGTCAAATMTPAPSPTNRARKGS